MKDNMMLSTWFLGMFLLAYALHFKLIQLYRYYINNHSKLPECFIQFDLIAALKLKRLEYHITLMYHIDDSFFSIRNLLVYTYAVRYINEISCLQIKEQQTATANILYVLHAYIMQHLLQVKLWTCVLEIQNILFMQQLWLRWCVALHCCDK